MICLELVELRDLALQIEREEFLLIFFLAPKFLVYFSTSFKMARQGNLSMDILSIYCNFLCC